ncbi:dynamin family protein [Helicobacter sp.]|uniref:dynamin family protein n=1 Tax=Helicobacter sp. TaxID=218 RepID=UPI0025C3F3BA|nr:dynamin family protein [Helicobacter sp.]MCI5969416.1 dynamin family protein [Helicobacter sp.]MDY2585671.1 dynamin family protein [Helicobacter sp.]
MEKHLITQKHLQERFKECFEKHFKEITPLGNLHLLEQDNASEILAILLSLDAQGFNAFYRSETLQYLCEKYCKTLSFKGIMQVQYTLLLNLQKAFFKNPKTTQTLLLATLSNLKILQDENLTTSKLLDSIHSYFETLINTEISQNYEKDSTFSTPKELLEDFLNTSLKTFQTQQTHLKERIAKDFTHLLSNLIPLESLLQKAQNQHFSLGITGVLSSGKSTLLNALLGKEILGSSTIPETASLTLLKYSKTPSACVRFWNAKEWQDLQSTLDENTLNALFSNEEFSECFKTFVQDSTQSLEIDINLLPKYTSANHPSKICNLVKETTLFTPLEFLQNNVEIVDTPGLDDPIVQREEITKDYLTKCDLLIHAMNAAQSATQIDRDFIIQSLHNANLSRILIVLTHADLLEKNELEAALNYTKESLKHSIKTALQTTQNAQNLELLFARLDFIALASYPALLCQIDAKKANALGYNLEDSNFNALLKYLNQTLLGKNSTKTKDIIYLCAQGFKRTLQNILDSIRLEQNLLFSQEDAVKAQITKAKQEKEQSKNALDVAKNALDVAKAQLKDFSATLQNQLHQKLQDAQQVLVQRLFADIIYEYERGKVPSTQRLEYLLDLGLKDSLSEILRFSTQSLEKKISQLTLQSQTHLENIGYSDNHTTLQKKNFNLHLNPTLLQKTKLKILNKTIQSTQAFNKNKQEALKNAIQRDFKEGFLEFITAIIAKSNALENQYIAHFTNLLDSAQQQLEWDLHSKEGVLQNALNHLNASTAQKQQREKILTETAKLLNAQIQECETLQDYATREQNA